jgi:hypothetical protein
VISTRTGATVVLGALLMTGCGSILDLDRSRADEDRRKNPAEGTQRVVAGDTGISFVLPDGWLVIDPSKGAAVAGTNPAVEDYLERTGISHAMFVEVMKRVHVLAMGPDQAAVNLSPGLGIERLPDERMVRVLLRAGGGKLESTETVRTPIGPGRIGLYTAELGEMPLHGAALYFEVEGKIKILSVITSTEGAAAQLLDDVTASLTLEK